MPHILIAEDNFDLRTIFLAVFSYEPFSAIAVDNGQAVLDYLHTASDLPDAVVLDLNMPELSGIDILRYIKENERTRHIKVIVVTGNPEFRNQPELAAADLFLDKPVDIYVLRRFAERLTAETQA